MNIILSILTLITTILGFLGTGSGSSSSENISRISNKLGTTTITINQGDKIVTHHNPHAGFATAGCTIGYVDHARNRAWTAAHCGMNGTEVFTMDGTLIGTLHHQFDYRGSSDFEQSKYEAEKDVAWIEPSDGVGLGKNIHSGDRIAANSDLVHDTQLCTTGATSNNVPQCGTIRSMEDSPEFAKHTMIVWSADTSPKSGDSGGPAWIPGVGMVGLNTIVYGVGGQHLVSGYTRIPQ